MMTRDFGMGFFGRNLFDKEAREKFREEWNKMTDAEKLDFMNKRVENVNEDRFSVKFIDDQCEEWMKKTPEEKEAFVNERKEFFKKAACSGNFHRGGFRGDFI